MADIPLVALSEFIDSLGEVETLLAAAPSQPPGEGGISIQSQHRDLVNAVNRSAMVMLVSHFEGFVKSALAELIDEICVAQPPTRRIPEGLLELHTRERIQEIFGTTGPDRIHKTRRLFSAYAPLWDADRTINPRILSARVLTRQFTNARPEVLNSVFSLLDVQDIVTQMDSHVNQAISDRGDDATRIKVSVKLEEIVNRRNKIAHGDRSEKPTRFEVEGYLIFLEDVAECLSTVLQKTISRCCSLR